MANRSNRRQTREEASNDVPLKEKDGEGPEGVQDELREEPQSEGVTRQNSLDSGMRGNKGAVIADGISPKALEAGFGGVKEKGGVAIVDWDGPDDPANPLK